MRKENNPVEQKQKENKTYMMHVRITDEELKELEAASYLDGRSKSEYMRRALKLYLYLKDFDPSLIEQID